MKFFRISFLIKVALISGFCFAQEEIIVKEMELAKYQVDANNFENAEKIYNLLLAKPLSSETHAIIRYNLAIIKLKQKQWDAASESLENILLGSNPNPILVNHIQSNLALAKLYAISEMPFSNEEDFNKIQTLLQSGLEDISEAKIAGCEVQQIKGALQCSLLKKEDLLKKQLLIAEAKTIKEKQQFITQHPTLNSGSLRMLLAIFSLDNILSIIVEDPKQKDKYETFLTIFLTMLQEEIVGLNKVIPPEKKKILEQIAEALNQAFFFKEQNNWNSFLDSVKTISARFDDLQKGILSTLSHNQSLANLFQLYELAKIEKPLQMSSLATILEVQKKEISLFSGREQEILQQAEQFLTNSIKFLEEKNEIAAAMSFEEGFFFIKRLFSIPDLNSPLGVLENAFDSHKQASALTHLTTKTDNVQPTGSIIPILLQANERVIKEAALFYPAIQKKQIELYDSGICQKNPWDEVIPLFSEGNEAVLKNTTLLSSKKEDLHPILNWQAITTQKWEQAIEKLRKWKPEIPSEEETMQKRQDVIQTFEEMELEDQQQKTNKPFPTSGFYSW